MKCEKCGSKMELKAKRIKHPITEDPRNLTQRVTYECKKCKELEKKKKLEK